MDKCRIVTHDEIVDDTSQRLVTWNAEESLSQSYVPGAFRMAERSALRRHLPDIDIPPSKPSAHIRERQAVMEIEAIGV